MIRYLSLVQFYTLSVHGQLPSGGSGLIFNLAHHLVPYFICACRALHVAIMRGYASFDSTRNKYQTLI